MNRADFDYVLPEDRIARYPLPTRSASRLLTVGPEGLRDGFMRDWPACLAPGDLLVVNDSRVIPARLRAWKETGGRIEILLIEAPEGERAWAWLKARHPPAPGSRLRIEPGFRIRVVARDKDRWQLALEGGSWAEVLSAAGEVPLPPYLGRAAEALDQERYQTVYAREPGSVAAPTAGLHFDEELLGALEARGVARTAVTLHVGPGTFEPLRTERIEDHEMHEEHYRVSEEAVRALAAAKSRGGRVIAVGTTVVRVLETLALRSGYPDRPTAAGSGRTRLFIRPGFEFRMTDALLTNFHQPGSTLLCLVSAFAGLERIRVAYAHALEAGYRFLSYGDAMWLPSRHAL